MSIGAAIIEKGTIDVTLDALGTVTSLSTVTVKPRKRAQSVDQFGIDAAFS